MARKSLTKKFLDCIFFPICGSVLEKGFGGLAPGVVDARELARHPKARLCSEGDSGPMSYFADVKPFVSGWARNAWPLTSVV
eukprot:5833727-Amphidinium_carterae.2